MYNHPVDLVTRDEKSIWHPYWQHGLGMPILPVASAKGAYLKLTDGREILDGISSWWLNLHGHSDPRMVEAIAAQAARMEHVIFSGFTHEPAVELAETLLAYPPIKSAGFSRVFYSDNGSTAVEAALKIAFQYHANSGVHTRRRFLALSRSYHGDTLGAMAVSEPSGFHALFHSLFPHVDFVEPGNSDQLKQCVAEKGDLYAGFIFEPLIQACSGMKIYDSAYLREAVELCRKNSILTIADEVFTGFFRTGTCFAFEQVGIKPDLLCLAKGLTGGYLPLAATLASEKIFSAFVSREIRHMFLHGHSFTANPVACAAAIESWKILHSPETRERIAMIEKQTRFHIEKLKTHPRVLSARSLGVIGAVELDLPVNYFSANAGRFLQQALAQNVLLRPLGNVLYSIPPYCCNEQEISRIYTVMGDLVDNAQSVL